MLHSNVIFTHCMVDPVGITKNGLKSEAGCPAAPPRTMASHLPVAAFAWKESLFYIVFYEHFNFPGLIQELYAILILVRKFIKEYIQHLSFQEQRWTNRSFFNSFVTTSWIY